MHQLAPNVSVASIKHQPVRKELLEEHDLQVVADLIYNGIRQGLYSDVIHARTRTEVLEFLRGIASKCEFRQYDPTIRRARRRVAALLVYTAQGAVVGFAILAEAVSDSIKRGVELLMFGVVTRHRGLGYGASILDSLIKALSQQYFNLIVKCPQDNQLLFAMLMTRGFLSLGRYCKGRILSLAPPLSSVRFSRVSAHLSYSK
jgi:ribosomal protein S18 acetylase RimI-like enzyme